MPDAANVSTNAFLTSGSGTLPRFRCSDRRRNVSTLLFTSSSTSDGSPAKANATPFFFESGSSDRSWSVMTCCMAVAMATSSSGVAAWVSSMVKRMPAPFFTLRLSRASDMARRSVSAAVSSKDMEALPRLADAMPAIPMDGPTVAVSMCHLLGSSAAIRRAVRPSEAVSEMVVQP